MPVPYCFARPTHTYLDFNAGRDFEKEIVVKVNAPEVLRVELARPSWKGEHVAMGTNTDPYQWVEGRYKLMRGIWEALRDAAQPVLGADEVAAAAARPRPHEARSPRSRTSARTSRSRRSTRRRGGRASRTRPTHGRGWRPWASSTGPGIPTGVLVAPLMPGINDDPAQVEEILRAAAEAGATGVSGIGLHLRGEVRGIFMEWLRVLPTGPRGALRGALRTRRVPAAGRAGADQRTHPARAGGDAGAAVRRLPARAAVATTSPCGPPNPGAERPPRPPEPEQTKLF